jgi:hypothetical protein
MSAVFDELVRLSGLSPIFARTVVKRAVSRAGVDPESVQRKDLDRVLPELQKVLSVYLGEVGANDCAAAIRKSFAG